MTSSSNNHLSLSSPNSVIYFCIRTKYTPKVRNVSAEAYLHWIKGSALQTDSAFMALETLPPFMRTEWAISICSWLAIWFGSIPSSSLYSLATLFNPLGEFSFKIWDSKEVSINNALVISTPIQANIILISKGALCIIKLVHENQRCTNIGINSGISYSFGLTNSGYILPVHTHLKCPSTYISYFFLLNDFVLRLLGSGIHSIRGQ